MIARTKCWNSSMRFCSDGFLVSWANVNSPLNPDSSLEVGFDIVSRRSDAAMDKRKIDEISEGDWTTAQEEVLKMLE